MTTAPEMLAVRPTPRWRAEAGQTFTEWIMIAGVLSAVGIAVFDVRRPWTIGGMFIYVGKSMFTFLRTMAP